MRTGPKPEGFQARIQFRHRKKDVSLTFPTELRYDTFRAVSPHKVIPVRASTRKYDDYKVYVTSDTSEIGEPVGIPEP